MNPTVPDDADGRLAGADAVLDFWFGPAGVDGVDPRWFARDVDFDAAIRDRFGATIDAAMAGRLDAWAASPRGWLALLIVLDQFPRNIHRGSALAFAGDAHARALAMAGLARGDDQALRPVERLFCYLPLEHAEEPALQARCVELFTALRDAAPAAQRQRFEDFLDYARRHRDVIHRFGRFPHRNAALGRASTDAERDYLAQPGAGF